MKEHFASIFVGAVAVLLAALAPGLAQGGVSRQVTPNGHVYWMFPIEEAARTAVAIDWSGGLTMLPEGRETAARVGVNLMLNGGAGGKTPDEIVADFQDLDAGSRLTVQPDHIRGFIVAPNQHLNTAANIANQVIATPNLDARWFARERKSLADQGLARATNLFGIGWSVAHDTMFGDHPYRRFWALRPVEAIENLSLDDIVQWHAAAFTTEGMTITAAGSAPVAAIGEAIDRALVGLPASATAALHEFPAASIPAKTIVFHHPEASHSLILAFGALPSGLTGSDLPLNLAVGVLGYGQQSRLFRSVRTGLRAAYGYRADYVDFTRGQRVLTMGGQVETALLQESFDTTRDTYETFRTDGISFVEFPIARRFYRQRIEDSLGKPADAAYLLMESRLNGHPEDDLPTLHNRIGALDRGAVNTFIAQSFPPFDAMLKIVVTPDPDAIAGDCVITSFDGLRSCF